MKVCPFLVAGQDSLLRERHGATWRGAAGSVGHAEASRDSAEEPEAQKATSTQLWAVDEEPSEETRSLECLGEPCRFYHAGGCRFDQLFAGNGEAGNAPGLTLQSLLIQEGDAEGPSLGSVLEEVWSLQRENLKEMIGGFRRLEGSQKQQQGSMRGHLEELATRLEESRSQNPQVMGILEERFRSLQENIAALEKLLQSSLGSSAADLKSALETTHDALAQVREDTGRDLHQGFETTQRLLQEAREVTAQLLREEQGKTQLALRTESEQLQRGVQQTLEAAIQGLHEEAGLTQRLLEESRDASSKLLQETSVVSERLAREGRHETQNLLRENREQTLQSIEATRDSLQQKIDEIPTLLHTALRDTREQLRQLVAQNSSESRAELEHTLQRVLDDNRHMQQLRDELKQSLQTLTDHVRQVADAAGTLAGSSRRAEELLAEQRNFSEALLQRERQEEARRLNNAGVMAYHEGAFDSSVAKFRKALELDPTMTEAWNNLGLSFTEMHQDDEALHAFKQALELDPKGGHVYNNLGYLYHRRGELEQAVEMYQRATNRAQDTSSAWSNLGNALYEMRRADEALNAWKRALELDPTNDKASHALERLGLETGN